MAEKTKTSLPNSAHMAWEMTRTPAFISWGEKQDSFFGNIIIFFFFNDDWVMSKQRLVKTN